jgi:proline iminopeptidase
MIRLSMLVLVASSFPLQPFPPLAAAPTHSPQGSELERGDFIAELNGLELWYRVAGKGPVCIFPSPGWGPSSDLYFRTLSDLEKTFTIVYLDTRGTGRSERAKALTEYTWEQLVADLEALRARLGQEKVWMMGHSEGGMQVLHYACRHSDRVSGLILLSTKASVGPSDRLGFMARVLRRKDESWFPEASKAYQAGPPKTDQEMAAWIQKLMPAYWADPRRMEKHQEHFAATSMSIEAMRGTHASRDSPFDLSADLKKVTAPALIITGDKDIVCPPAGARQLHLSLPNSKFLLLDDCGHFPWLEQADEFKVQVPLFLEALGVRADPRRSG